jgi:hypothetical protein
MLRRSVSLTFQGRLSLPRYHFEYLIYPFFDSDRNCGGREPCGGVRGNRSHQQTHSLKKSTLKKWPHWDDLCIDSKLSAIAAIFKYKET